MGTCISEELEAPDEFDDVEDAEESRVGKVPVVGIFIGFGGEGEVLEDDEGHEGDHRDEEDQDVHEGAGPLMQEAVSIIQEDALKAQLVRVEPEHGEDNDSQQEAHHCHRDLPSSVIVEETECRHNYFDDITRVSTPSAIKVKIASTWAVCGAIRGKRCTNASQIRPSPRAVMTVAQKADLKPL